MRVPISNFNRESLDLPLREKDSAAETGAASPDRFRLGLEPVLSKETLIVTVDPPHAPARPLTHVPSDIVLVIDVSGSMGSPAPIPGDDSSESTGLSILDLVKHAACTILETMGDDDRLGIVTFDATARVIQALQPMTAANKRKARRKIQQMASGTATNLWHGMLEAIKAFEKATKSNNVPAMMVLTDGMPNHMCPQIGYIPKMRPMMPFPATIHTFGFGYSLDSGLLKSIAEIGGGNYAFIPDAGMVGTVFVHAVANLHATCATDATLTLTYPEPIVLEEAMGESVDQTPPQQLLHQSQPYSQLTIRLGNILYGQSRDIVLRVRNLPSLAELGEAKHSSPPIVDANLTFTNSAGEVLAKRSSIIGAVADMFSQPQTATSVAFRRSLLDETRLPNATVAYHESRARIAAYISSVFPLAKHDKRRVAIKDLSTAQENLTELIKDLPAKQYSDPRNLSLVEDLVGEEPMGQISIAINDATHFYKWGIHYLPSYLNAHTRQICNSFKDPGPMQYGSGSPLFIQCRDRLDTTFDQLPPPVPSLTASSSYRGHLNMNFYNNPMGPCFAGSVPVELASGRIVPIRKLRRGVKVRTPAGPRRVALVLKTPVQNAILCRVGREMLVTPWHPISCDGGKTWAFPANVPDRGVVRYTGAIFSVLLQRDRNSASHALRLGGAWGVALGHGILSGHDVRAHEFLGDYNNVAKALLRLQPDKTGVVVGGGVERDHRGLVCGFRKRIA